MATYVVGDIHGCFNTFSRLLASFSFNAKHDKLWLVGDVVGRGPASLKVLRWVREHENCVTMVLGNHDIHLLAISQGVVSARERDNLDELLAAPDADSLCAWLRQQPLVHAQDNRLMMHAGLLPDWDAERAHALGEEASAAIQSDDWDAKMIYGDTPTSWDDKLSGDNRWRVIINVLTRLRVCTPDGDMYLGFSGEPQNAPDGYLPWFETPQKSWAPTTVFFGHWSALGFFRRQNLLCLDSGCLWGRQLTAMRLEDGRIFQEMEAEA